MQKEAKNKIRKRLLGIVLCLALVLTGISVPAVKTYAADNEMSVTEFDGTEKIIPVGTKVVPREGHTLTVYSWPEGGNYLLVRGEYWIADQIYRVTEEWGNNDAYDDWIVLASVVVDPSVVSAVSLDRSSMTMTNYTSEILTATITPETATNKAVTWSSSNDAVVKVAQNGMVTAACPGTATITVTTADGGKTASCTVTVESMATVAKRIIENALPTWSVSNATTKEDLDDFVKNVLAAENIDATDDTKLRIAYSNYEKTDATETTVGHIICTIVIVSDSTVDYAYVYQEIPALASVIPTATPTPTPTQNPGPTAAPNPAQSTDPTSIPTPTPAADHIGDVKNDTHTEQNAAEAGLDESIDELTAKVLSDEDRTALAAGKNAVILLTVTDGAATITAEDQQLIESARGTYALGSYLDITLWKQIDGEEAQKVTATNGAVTIRFQIPDNLLNTDNSVTRTYYVIRVHDGSTDILPCTFDPATGTASFETDRFSSYAVVYRDSTAAAPDESPKTGVIDNTYLWCLLALLSGAGMVYLGKKSRLAEK